MGEGSRDEADDTMVAPGGRPSGGHRLRIAVLARTELAAGLHAQSDASTDGRADGRADGDPDRFGEAVIDADAQRRRALPPVATSARRPDRLRAASR